MDTAVFPDTRATEKFLATLPEDITIGRGQHHKYVVSSYWPHHDVVRGRGCFGHGETLGEAIAAMLIKLEEAKTKRQPLRTASECKAAVIELIQEHNVSPAAFRDAVDDLPVGK